ncbi:response regulator transcription factor [Conexibacter sp. DBS9H8]|uniref:winged helix-turn-helix transcriptional regulator n=1 Tax=Conexibacter sp. DBS9H8 TaxID=2937801 RepID=UPI00200D08E8|nr:response regulator transcription factor [Conexibacter sp. DBS9H8]
MSGTEVSTRVLVLDGDPERGLGRVRQLLLDGFDAESLTRESVARERLADIELVVLGDLQGSAAASLAMLRDVRAGRIERVNQRLRAIALADSEPQILSAYQAGADMTLPRAVSGTLLSASIAALARRSWPTVDVVRLGALEVDRAGRTAQIDGRAVKLTAREFDLLDTLAKAPGRVFTREELSREVWGQRHLQGSRAIDTTAHRMASKLRGAGAQRALIQNVWGQGYKLNEGSQR